MLSEEDYNNFSIVGNALALICFNTSDLREVLNKQGQSLEKIQKENLIEEFICFRISFVEDVFSALFRGYPNKILMNAFSNCIRQNFGENNLKNINYKISEYRGTKIDDFLIDILLKNSGITEKNFKTFDKSALKFFLESDMKKYIRYTREILNIVLSEHNERSKKLKYFNEYIGKDFLQAYLFLNDALKNKNFDVEISKSGGLIFFLVIISIFLMVLGMASSNSKNVSQSPPIIVAEKNNEEIEKNIEHQKTYEQENKQQKNEYSAPKKETQNTQSKKKVDPIPKSGVYTEYDYSQEILNNDGLCEFTVDNTRNDMPVYVRIWDMNLLKPVRAFTIAQGEKFTVEDLSPGRYEVRYKELYENDVPPFGSKSEIFYLEQYETFSGISYSVMELTLYKVVGGNTRTTQIDVNDV